MQSIQTKAAELNQNKSDVPAAKPEKALKDLIKRMEPAIKKALPSVITPERFMRIVESAISRESKLALCTPDSFLAALMTGAQLGLECNTPLGHAYLIPYFNGKKKCYECQFQIGYKGYIDLANRSGEITQIGAYEICEHDDFSFELGLHADIKHHYSLTAPRGKVIGYYGKYNLVNGGSGFEIMTLAEVQKHRDDYCKATEFSPWQTNFDEMAKKTVLKKALKYAPLKIDTVRALSNDGAVRHEISDDMSVVPSDIITAEFADEPQTESK